jgi:hypothetical protein
MSDDEALSRIEGAADAIASAAGGHVDTVQIADGSWVVSIEPSGEEVGDWAVTSGGPTEAKALSNLIQEAKDQGLA